MRILLLSDATMCLAGGIGQTLYNVFSFSDPKDLLCITSDKTFKLFPPTEPFTSCYITYKFEIINVPDNRITKYVKTVIEWLNYNYNRLKSFRQLKKSIEHFNPEIIVTCPNGPAGLFMHFKLLKGLNIKNVFPYFMDDWMHQVKNKWLKKKTDGLAKKILAENHSWLMISKNLSDILMDRYSVKPERLLEIHNPVDLSNLSAIQPVKKKEHYVLVYAGALWQMHFDALLVIAEAVNILKKQRSVDFIIYTSEGHWNWRKKELQKLTVRYGGNIPYKEIHSKLSEADCLIITSSFSKEWYTHSKGSLQTKMTDYLKAQRLIISCGPAYSANNQFLKKHDCGICIETNNINESAIALNNILDRIYEKQSCVINGLEILNSEFSFEKVHKKLKEFLAA